MRQGLRKFLHLPRSADRIRDDVDDEIRFDLDMRTQALMREGLDPDEARRRALTEFGNVEATRRYCEAIDRQVEADQRRSDRLGDLRSDLVLAARSMRRAPAFAVIVLATLALGIGANTTIFSIVRRTLIAPLPYRDPAALYRLYTTPTVGSSDTDKLSAVELAELSNTSRSVTGVAQFGNYGGATYTDGQIAEPWQSAQVSLSFFDVLGVAPALGRRFLDDDIAAGAEPVVMLGHAIWQRVFAGDPGIVGRTVQLNDRDYRVVGVLPRTFVGPTFTADVLLPLNTPGVLRNARANRARVWRSVVRLHDGATLEAFASELALVRSRVASQYPEFATAGAIRPVPLHTAMLDGGKSVLLLVMAGAALVLVVTCVNIAGLFLSRATRRHREVSLRVALGASRGRLMRQLLTESVVYAVSGGLLGVLLAVMTKETVVGFAGSSLPPLGEVQIDSAVLAFAAAVSVLCGLLFGLLPAMAAVSGDPRNALAETGSRTSSQGRSGARGTRVLVAAQLALAVVLVIGAGLLVRTFVTLVNADVGYRADASTITFRVNLPGSRYDDANTRAGFTESFVERVRELPGVLAAGYTAVAPWNGGLMTVGFQVDGRTIDDTDIPNVEYATASDGFFDALGIPLRAGRAFNAADRLGSAPVIVVSESVVRRFWPGASPLGARVRLGTGSSGADEIFEVVGVVGDVRPGVMAEKNATVYVSERQRVGFGGEFAIHTAGDAMVLLPAIRQVLRELDPRLPIFRPRPMQAVLEGEAARQRLAMILMGAFAALALVLSSMGLYGVLAYAVAGRAREFGIRSALGARRSTILALVFRQGMVTTVAGVICGVVIAAMATRFLGSLLVGISAHDAMTFALAPLLLFVVAALACVIPAWTATRVQPVDALRSE